MKNAYLVVVTDAAGVARSTWYTSDPTPIPSAGGLTYTKVFEADPPSGFYHQGEPRYTFANGTFTPRQASDINSDRTASERDRIVARLVELHTTWLALDREKSQNPARADQIQARMTIVQGQIEALRGRI